MAQHPSPIMSSGPEQVVVAFRFRSNLATDPDAVVNGAGVITDIVEAAGVYTCTLASEYRYLTLVACTTGVEGETLDSSEFTSYTSATGALVVTTFQAATDAAAQVVGPPTNDNTWVHVIAVLCRRSQLAPTETI